MANNKAFKVKNGLQAGRYLLSNGSVTTGTGTVSLDLSTGTTFYFAQSGATTVSFTNPPASGLACAFTVEINGDSSEITWPSSVKWHEDTAPTTTSTKELYTFVTTNGGTSYYGRKVAEDLK